MPTTTLRFAEPAARAAPGLHRRSPRFRTASAELGALGIALTIGLVAVAHLTVTDRAWMLFSDGDSVLPAMVHGSLADGQPQHWAMSAVLFLPELALYLTIAAVAPSTGAALAINGVVNVALLYLAFRSVTAVVLRGAPRSRRIGGALLAVGVLGGLTLLDSSRSWDSAELPSLVLTTTYYFATLLTVVLAPALAVAALRGAGRSRGVLLVLLGAVAALSTMTDPLFVGWVAVPLTLATAVVAGRGLLSWRQWGALAGSLAAGAVAGLLLRLPFAGLIARDSTSYVQPGRALHVLFGYYLRLTLERLATPAGVVEVAVDLALLVVSVLVAIDGVRRRSPGRALVGTFGALAPVVVLLGAVMLGTAAYRYLQPAYVAPLLALACLPERFAPIRGNASPRGRRVLMAAVGTATAVGAILAGAQTAAAAAAPDPSIRCLDAWITASHRVGAGRFETIRGPKAYLADPRQLVQVTRGFRGFLWLVNRDDYAVKRVSFVVSDTTTPPPFVQPIPGAPLPTVTTCGSYTISDYGAPVLPIGPLTSAYDP